MKIIPFALGLIERHGDRFGFKPEVADDIAARYAAEIDETTEMVEKLFERRAGFATDVSGVCDENRLGDPRLRTTYPDERRRALTNRLLRYNDGLADLLPKVFELTVRVELAQVELAEERRRDREYRDADHLREELDLYAEVIDTINALYHDYQVTRRHYACLSDEQLRDIAAIILRQPASAIPIKPRHPRRGKRHG